MLLSREELIAHRARLLELEEHVEVLDYAFCQTSSVEELLAIDRALGSVMDEIDQIMAQVGRPNFIESCHRRSFGQRCLRASGRLVVLGLLVAALELAGVPVREVVTALAARWL